MRQFVDAKARALGIRVDHHMRVVIIGGTGHIGSFLTPRLVEAGHALTCVSRGMKRQEYSVPVYGGPVRAETHTASTVPPKS